MTQASKKRYVQWQEVEELCTVLHKKVTGAGYTPDLLIGLSRGGLVPLGYLAGEKMFDIRDTYAIALCSYDQTKQGPITMRVPVHVQDFNKYRSILVIDDLIDSGKTMSFVLSLLHQYVDQAQVKTGVLFYKKDKSPVVPDYYARETKDWIVFPWEKE